MDRFADFWREFDLPLLGRTFPLAEHDERAQALGEEGDDPNWGGLDTPIDIPEGTVTTQAMGEEGDDPNWGGQDILIDPGPGDGYPTIDPGDGAGHFSTDVGSADNWEPGGL